MTVSKLIVYLDDQVGCYSHHLGRTMGCGQARSTWKLEFPLDHIGSKVFGRACCNRKERSLH